MQLSFRPGVALLAGALGLGAFLTSCSGGGSFSKTKSGIEYKLFKKEGGKYVAKDLPGGEDPTYKDRLNKGMLAYVYVLNGKDSLLQNTRGQFHNHPVPLPLMPIKRKGRQDEAFAMLQPGDSAVFRFNADSLLKGSNQPMPKEIKRGGNVLVMRVVAVKLVDQAEAMAAEQEISQMMRAEQASKMQEVNAEQNKKDDVLLQEYIKKNNLTAARKLPSGVYVLTTQPGSGPNVKPGQMVSVQYAGMLLNGTVFDASAKHEGGKPFRYPAGVGGVIPGWDEGVQQLNPGSKATILIPSSLGYGPQGNAGIPPNSPLRFDIEVVGVEDAKAPGMAGPAPAAAPAR